MTDQDGAASADAEDSAAGEESPEPVPVTVEWTAPDWLEPGDEITFEVSYHLGESKGASDPIKLLPEFDWGDSGAEYHYTDPPETLPEAPEAPPPAAAPVDAHPTLLAHPVWRYDEDPLRPLRALPADAEFIVDLEVQAPGLEEKSTVDFRVLVEGEEAPLAELQAEVIGETATVEWTLPPTPIGAILRFEADAADVEDEPVRTVGLPVLGTFDFGDTGEPGAPPELWEAPPPRPPITTPVDQPIDPLSGASWLLAEEPDEGLTGLLADQETEVVLALDAQGSPPGAEIPIKVFAEGQEAPLAELVAVAGVRAATVTWTVAPLPVGARVYFTADPVDPDDPPPRSASLPVRPPFQFGDADVEAEDPPAPWAAPAPRVDIAPPSEGIGPRVHAIRWFDPDTATQTMADRGVGEAGDVQIELQVSGYVVGDTITGQVRADGVDEPLGTFEATVEETGALDRALTTWALPAQEAPTRLVAEVTLGEVITRSAGLYIRPPFPFGDGLEAEAEPAALAEPPPLPAVTTPADAPRLHIGATSWLDPDGHHQLHAPGGEPFEIVLDVVSDLTLPPTFSGSVIRGSDAAEVTAFEATPIAPGRAAVTVQIEAQPPGEVLYATFEAEGEAFRSVPLHIRPPFGFGDGLLTEDPPAPLVAAEVEPPAEVPAVPLPAFHRVWLLGPDGGIQLIAGLDEETPLIVEIDTENIALGEAVAGRLVSDGSGAEVLSFEAPVAAGGRARAEITVPAQSTPDAIRAVVTYADATRASAALRVRPAFDFGDTRDAEDPPAPLAPVEPPPPMDPAAAVPRPTLHTARWEQHGRAALKAPVGGPITLAVGGDDHPDGTPITFRIIDADDAEHATLDATLDQGTARAEWPAIAAETPFRFVAEGPDGLVATSALLHPTPALPGT